MTEEQKFLFDVKGWLLIPAVLSDAEIQAVKAHLYAGGDGYTGPAQELLLRPLPAVEQDALAAGAQQQGREPPPRGGDGSGGAGEEERHVHGRKRG